MLAHLLLYFYILIYVLNLDLLTFKFIHLIVL